MYLSVCLRVRSGIRGVAKGEGVRAGGKCVTEHQIGRDLGGAKLRLMIMEFILHTIEISKGKKRWRKYKFAQGAIFCLRVQIILVTVREL